MHCTKLQAEWDVKQLFGFYYYRNVTSKCTRIEFPGSLWISLTQGNAPYDSFTQGTIDRAVKEIFK